jgi:hypothetical protein
MKTFLNICKRVKRRSWKRAEPTILNARIKRLKKLHAVHVELNKVMKEPQNHTTK